MKGNGTHEMGRFSVEITIANQEDLLRAKMGDISPEQVRQVTLPGVVDTGATRLVLPASVVSQLNLNPAGKTRVRYADQRKATRQIVKYVWLRLMGREGVFSAVVEPNRTDALIGAIVLEELDLVADCITQTLHPRDPNWIISEIE